MADKPLLVVKFAKALEPSAGKRDIEKWVGKELVDAKPLFPDTDDAELSTFFEVYLQEDSEPDSVAQKLQEHDEVEYAHEPAVRETK